MAILIVQGGYSTYCIRWLLYLVYKVVIATYCKGLLLHYCTRWLVHLLYKVDIALTVQGGYFTCCTRYLMYLLYKVVILQEQQTKSTNDRRHFFPPYPRMIHCSNCRLSWKPEITIANYLGLRIKCKTLIEQIKLYLKHTLELSLIYYSFKIVQSF